MLRSDVAESFYTNPPSWAKKAIWYQIFVERFYNGDKNNDPIPSNMQGAWPHTYDENWKMSTWTSDWYANAPQSKEIHEVRKWYETVQSRRYGGDLQGIIDKLEYIKLLGVTAIYLNPINDAPSLHKYDARSYHHVDVHFGPKPMRDSLMMKRENPNDPDTWIWTSADKLFLELVGKIHDLGMKVIVDFSFNHTGVAFWAWKDLLTNGINSEFADWYDIITFKMPSDYRSEFYYNTWMGIKELPLLRKIKFTAHQKGQPYNGTLPEDVKKHIFDITRRWLAPAGYDKKYGIDGFRLDVADEIGLDFWREFREHVKSINPEAYLLGEVWWENWPDTMMDPRPYITHDVFDSVMYYQPFKYARDFFAKTIEYQGAQVFVEQLKQAFLDIPLENIQATMMMSASHDTPRLLSSFYNRNRYKFLAKPLEDIYYKTERPNLETYLRVKLYLVFLFTMPGAPQIWAGDEMGMWGADDPDCRKPLWWPELKFDPETSNPFRAEPRELEPIGFNQSHNLFYKKLIDLRKNHPVLMDGALSFIYAKEDVLVYRRHNETENIYVIFNNNTEKTYLEHIEISGKDIWLNKKTSSEANKNLSPMEFKIIRT